MDIIKWVSIDDEKPFQKEMVLAASKDTMAMCIAFIHGEYCPLECKHIPGEISFYSNEKEGATLRNVTHFTRIRNPNEVLQ